MKNTLRMTLLPLVIGALVGACSGGSTPVDPAASSARDVDGGSELHEMKRGALGVGDNTGGATPIAPQTSFASDVHGGILPHGVTNGAGEGKVHPLDVGTCQSGCCFSANSPS